MKIRLSRFCSQNAHRAKKNVSSKSRSEVKKTKRSSQVAGLGEGGGGGLRALLLYEYQTGMLVRKSCFTFILNFLTFTQYFSVFKYVYRVEKGRQGHE